MKEIKLIAVSYEQSRLDFFMEQLESAERKLDWWLKHSTDYETIATKGEIMSFYEWAVEMAENEVVKKGKYLELPNGNPGDYLEWDIGTGDTRFYRISAIHIDERTIRYDIGDMCPVIDHKNIVRILTPEEMKKEIAKIYPLDDTPQEGAKTINVKIPSKVIHSYGERKDNDSNS